MIPSLHSRQLHPRRLHREKGGAAVEFAICFAFLMVPLLMGTLTVGLSLVRTIQLTEVCRTAARLYASGMDLSSPTHLDLLASLGPELGMTANGGNAVLFLSRFSYVAAGDCSGAGYNGCLNAGKTVITNRIVAGNLKVHSTSDFGTPGCALLANGDVPLSCRYMNTSVQSANLASLVPLSFSRQSAFTAEMWIASPGNSFWNDLGIAGGSARSVFGQ